MRGRFVPHAVAAAITAVVLAPLALPGYVLRYDMVFVPRQPLSWEMVAPADALPRAVPLDALVSLANLAVPGWLLQRMVLVAIVYLAALGAARLVPTGRTLHARWSPRWRTPGRRTSPSGCCSASGGCCSRTPPCPGWWRRRGTCARAGPARWPGWCSPPRRPRSRRPAA